MEINTCYLTTPKTTRYATYGNLSPKTKYFWFCLHGSKMQCEQVLYKFSDFDPEEHYVVAPEGMHKQYLKDFGGDVVATWMTKRDRLDEITDFSLYLTTLYNQEVVKVPKAKKICFGFSQGGTTMYRWLHNDNIDVDAVLGYSCWIPEDIDLLKGQTSLNAVNHIYTYGNQDQFLTEERLSLLKDVIVKNKLDLKILPFQGGHKINREWLQELFSTELRI